jgi:hypothetical protein
VSELEGDIAAADEQQGARQLVEVEKAIAGGDVLGAGNR